MDGSGNIEVNEQQMQSDTSSARRKNAPTALAVDGTPIEEKSTADASTLNNNESVSDEEQPSSSQPASPHNIHSMLSRPFGDVMREVASGFQLKSTAQVAAQQLQYLVFHRDHDKEVLGSSMLMGLLVQQIREAPGLPCAGSCMAVLAQLARTPEGRSQLRAHGVLQLIVKFLGVPDVLSKANAQPALLLLQNSTCDKLCRHIITRAGCIELLLHLLAANPVALKQQQAQTAAYLTGTLLNLVAADGDGSSAKQVFAEAGGMEVACKVLAEWGRFDSSPSTLRLRLLLADLGKLQQYTAKLHQTALDAITSARTGYVDPSHSTTSAAGAPGGQASGHSTSLALDVMSTPRKGIPLGTPRMPASERITAVVLQHGKDLLDRTEEAEALEEAE